VTSGLQELARRINACLPRDRDRLAHRLRAVLAGLSTGRATQADLLAVRGALEQAEGRLQARRARIPPITYPPDLPIAQRREEISAALREHQVIVVCGETGSGKTTQLPKMCLEVGRGLAGMIGHTQPRRIAARSVAARIAEELSVPLGGLVGYKVRFGDQTSPGTVVKVMTDGILLAETQGDRDLSRYDTIIVDEAHERSLNIDFLLGYLRRLLPRRPDLKVIITSATIDPERLSEHFGGAPIISVSGRTYPVEVIYRPSGEEGLDERDAHLQAHIVEAVDECATRGDGDILVFLSGEREIRETARTLAKHHVPGAPGTKVLPLFARLSAAEQMEVFRPHAHRRIVLATNVAETSLTVPGIRYVVDTGVARIGRYSARTRVQRLEVEAISRASADQRAGRCGRLGPGVCVRLYAREDYERRPRFTDPEVLRTSLASVILQMIALRLGRVEDFPFVDPPEARLIRDGYDTLRELGAIDGRDELTGLGAEMARLPIDPRVSRMLLASRGEPPPCGADVLVIAAALSVQDPRERPLERQSEADAAHAAFRDPRSDFLGLLRLWDWYQDRKRHLSGSRLRALCRDSFVSFVRLREWEDLHHQLAELMGASDSRLPRRGRGASRADRPAHPVTSRPPLEAAPGGGARADAIHRGLLTGLLSNVGCKGEQGEFSGVRGTKFRVFPGSVLFRNAPRWVIGAELVRTTHLYLRTAAGVEPEWIERAAGHLASRSHYDPHWDARSGRVMAFERVSLMGLPLASGRRVHFGPIDPPRAREVFILHALVKGEMLSEAECLARNAALVAQMRELEARCRKPGLLADEHRCYLFYAARVPAMVSTASQFERWLKDAPARTRRGMEMTPEDLIEPGTAVPSREDFPDVLDLDQVQLPLVYRYEPGHEADGVTVSVPARALPVLSESRLAWLVPGLLGERVEHALRGVPREFRRLLPPQAELATIAPSLEFGRGSLFQQVAGAISRRWGIDVPPESLERAPVPEYLRLRVEVLDDSGAVIAAGRDLAAIRAHVDAVARPRAGGGVIAGAERYHRDGLLTWDFGDLPERVEIDRFGTRFAAYPGLVDRGADVALRLFERRENADAATRGGLRRLFLLDAADEVRRYTHQHPDIDGMVVSASSLGSPQAFRRALTELIADRALKTEQPPPRNAEAFKARCRAGVDGLGDAVREACELADPILRAYGPIAGRLAGPLPAAWGPVLADIRDQLSSLLGPDFLIATPVQHLRHYPRYLAAIDIRLQRLAGAGLARDLQRLDEIRPIWLGWHELVRRRVELGLSDAAIAEYRWLVEELRVSLFAQELRTAVPVSVKRLHEKWEQVLAR
jgi:ATP-dependent helicase HrpA